MVLAQLTFVGCLPCTRHCAGHHTHVTSLDPPKHLPTTSEASSIVIPILQMKKVRHWEVRSHNTSARAEILTQFCQTWEPSLRSTRPQAHQGKQILRATIPRSMSTYTKRYTARNTEPCHYIEISKHSGTYMPAKNQTKIHDGPTWRKLRDKNLPSKIGTLGGDSFL